MLMLKRSVWIVAGLLAGLLLAPGRVGGQDADPGKRAFSDAGCVMCHGPSGRGADGPSLVPMEREFTDFLRVVREGIGEMPGQAEADVTDGQIARVYEFLVGLSGRRDGGAPGKVTARAASRRGRPGCRPCPDRRSASR